MNIYLVYVHGIHINIISILFHQRECLISVCVCAMLNVMQLCSLYFIFDEVQVLLVNKTFFFFFRSIYVYPHYSSDMAMAHDSASFFFT